MDRKRATRRTTAVVAGSVWETRMMNDQIMGGFKVFNPTQDNKISLELEKGDHRKQRIVKQSPAVKRKTWKSGDPIQIGGSVVKKSPDSRNPIGNRKSVSKSSDLDDGDEKSSICRMKMGSNESKEIIERTQVHNRIIGDGNEKNLAQSGEIKTESVNVIDESQSISKPLLRKGSDELRNIGIGSEIAKMEVKQSVDESTDEIEIVGSNLEEEKSMSRALINVGDVNSVPRSDHKNAVLVSNEEDLEAKIVAEKPKQSIEEMKLSERKPKDMVNNEKKMNQIKEKPLVSSSSIVKKSPHIVNYSRLNPTPKAKAIPEFDRFQSKRVPQTHGKLQSLIDLVMWRDASRSAFIFGGGTFIIISSSYAKDLNFSLISGFSYLGLGYLAAIFIFRPIISRETVVISEPSDDYAIGEEEAVWLLKMVLPYLNEFLIKIKALFSGDPATTLKMGVMLFVLARCGSSITIWKMAKLGFFGVFTVPKICSSYSTQLTAYGKFWVRRFKDAWESCTHKKAVGFGIFTLVWNLSSVVARIWAVFMLFVAFRYYQQSMVTDDNHDDCVADEKPKCEPSQQGFAGARRLRRGVVNVESMSKEKKKI